MSKIIDKVAAIIHYVDGRKDEGFLPCPARHSGQCPAEFITLTKEGGIEVFINLSHVISIEQAISYRA